MSSITNKTRDYRIKLEHNNTIIHGISPFTIPLKNLTPCTNYTINVDNCNLNGENVYIFNGKSFTGRNYYMVLPDKNTKPTYSMAKNVVSICIHKFKFLLINVNQ